MSPDGSGSNGDAQQANSLNNNDGGSTPQSTDDARGAPIQASNEGNGDFLIVGVGASAGGLKALQAMLSAMPDDPGLALVVIQHLDPTKASLTAELLSRETVLNVAQVQESVRVEPNHVYVIPPNKYLRVEGGTLHLGEPEHRRGVRVPIDFFLRSLAVDQQEKAAAVILSGTGTDGTLGVKAVKSHGGLVIAQEPQTAEFSGMPQSAIATGIVDDVLPAEEIAETLVRYARHPDMRSREVPPDAVAQSQDDLNSILALLRTQLKHDFRSYKQTTILRRTRRRMGLKNIPELSEYRDYLRENPEEVKALKKDLLISVTDFFREPDAWTILEQKVLVPLLERKDPDAPVRVWVPGCATGEEPYTVAMLLQEHMQRMGRQRPFTVFASDVDRDALEYARQGRYPDTIRADVSPDRLRRFFTHEINDHHYLVGKQLRESIVFAEQNLIGDPPYSRLDLICCRNLMIYLKPEVQQKIIALFHFALSEQGCLFLGNAETVGRHEDMFHTISQKWRIYRRAGPNRRDRVEFPIVGGLPRQEFDPPAPPAERRDARLAKLAQERLLDWIAPAAVLVDPQGVIHYYSGDVDLYLTHTPGAPTQSLFAKARQGLRTQLRVLMKSADDDGRTVSAEVRVKRDGRFHPLRLTARRISDYQYDDETLVLIMFEELESARAQNAEPSSGRGASGSADGEDSVDVDSDTVVRHLEDELAAAREDLQSTVEQLGSSNEEFKAANEEMMSINEELQSANEELETSKEELQSLNEELNTVNQQLAMKVDELQASNDDLSNLLSSTDLATICLDRDLHIKWFTPATTRLMNLTPADVGRPLSDFSHGFTTDNLLESARGVLERLTTDEVETTTRDDAVYLRRITPYRTEVDRIDGVVVTFIDVTERKRLQEALRAQEFFEFIFETVREPMLVLEPGLRVVSANQSFYRVFEIDCEHIEGRLVHELDDRQWNVPRLRDLLERIVSENAVFNDFEVEHDFPRIGRRTMILNARRIDVLDLILLSFEDVTDRRRRDRELTNLRTSLERQVNQRVQMLKILHEVTFAANQAQTVEDGLQAALRAVCGYNDWFVGHAWRLDDEGRMASAEIWYLREDADDAKIDVPRLKRVTAGAPLASERSLVEKVRTTRRPQWIEDLRRWNDWQPGDAEELGLRAAIAFPVPVDGEVVAVLECFSDGPLEREERFMEIMPDVGFQLGHLFERKRLERSIAGAAAAQQRHFARELHDSVAQEITGVHLMAQTLHSRLQQNGSDHADRLAKIIDHLRNTQGRIRRLSRGLAPVDVDPQGLAHALEELTESCNAINGVECTFEGADSVPVENAETATELYRIAQEAIQNALKHANGTRIDVSLKRDDHHVVLKITDDGDGLPPEEVLRSHGSGRRIMQYRANLIGAELNVDSTPGDGVKITCRLPA